MTSPRELEPDTYPAIPGQDIDIDGNVWPGSDYEKYLIERDKRADEWASQDPQAE